MTAVALAGVASAQTAIDETRPAKPDVDLTIVNVKGSVEVTGWDQAAVQVAGKLDSNSDRLEFSGPEDRQTIKVYNPNESKRVKEARLTVRVPFGASVEVSCVSAKITVENVEGDLDLHTVSGKVDATGVAGRVRAETVSGAVDVEGRPVSVEAKAVSGSVDILATSKKPLHRAAEKEEGIERTYTERIQASTVSGSIDVEAIEVGRLECETVSGSIDFTGAIAPNGDVELKTHSGSIGLNLPADTSAEFDLSTFSGNIKSDLGGYVEKPKFGPGSSLEYVSGSGSAKIRAQAFSGGISIEKQ